MENNKILAMVLLILLCISGHASSSSKTFFVRMKPNSSALPLSISSKILYIYKNFDGFTVSLTKDEAHAMKASDDVDFIQVEQTYELHTTRSPWFMGMEGPAAPKLNPVIWKASQVVIGFVDTGVWPETPSFNDHGSGPAPSTWKGGCDKNVPLMCNKKLVGARSFSKGYRLALATLNFTMEMLDEPRSPRDLNGHGTHTTSTAGGSPIPNASLFGFANGTAHGMAESARLAAYKACWKNGCFGSDILAAIDQAIDDNVDVLSLSFGSDDKPLDYYNDTIAIAAFAAIRKGIVVTCSAGNDGPAPHTVSNVAPWMLTVGAGTMDRDFFAPLTLGNNKTYDGVSLFFYNGKRNYEFLTPLPMVYARDASIDGNSSFCLFGTLVPDKVKGKIVLCDRGEGVSIEKGGIVEKAGGRGMVLANTAEYGDEVEADEHLLPATAVRFEAGEEIKKYLALAGSNASASIWFEGTVLGVEPSPARFSSRGGPHPLMRLLKPDLIAPGVNILAAWPDTVPPSVLPTDKRSVKFNIRSGTSMSCSHVSGLAALLKATHPDWSPAAIRSALMTTAYSTYENGTGNILDAATGKPATPYGIGAGHVRPVAALDPGLVYDLSKQDYCNFLCALNYGPAQIRAVTKTNFTTCEKEYRVSDLNYPSFVVSVEEASQKGGVIHARTLTNVGPTGTYRVSVLSPTKSSINISVDPVTLTFNKPNEKKSYTVTFKAGTSYMHVQGDKTALGRIEWSDDDNHVVGSPIVFSLE